MEGTDQSANASVIEDLTTFGKDLEAGVVLNSVSLAWLMAAGGSVRASDWIWDCISGA